MAARRAKIPSDFAAGAPRVLAGRLGWLTLTATMAPHKRCGSFSLARWEPEWPQGQRSAESLLSCAASQRQISRLCVSGRRCADQTGPGRSARRRPSPRGRATNKARNPGAAVSSLRPFVAGHPRTALPRAETKPESSDPTG